MRIGSGFRIIHDMDFVGISLVARMSHVPLLLGHEGADSMSFNVVDLLRGGPLLEFDNDNVIFA